VNNTDSLIVEYFLSKNFKICLSVIVLKVLLKYPKNIANLSEKFRYFFCFLVFHSHNSL